MREKAPIPRAREQREELELLKLGTCRRVPVGVTLRPLRSRRYLAGTGVSMSGGRVPGGWHREGVVERLGGQGEEAGDGEVSPIPWMVHTQTASRQKSPGRCKPHLPPALQSPSAHPRETPMCGQSVVCRAPASASQS